MAHSILLYSISSNCECECSVHHTLFLKVFLPLIEVIKSDDRKLHRHPAALSLKSTICPEDIIEGDGEGGGGLSIIVIYTVVKSGEIGILSQLLTSYLTWLLSNSFRKFVGG